MIMSRRIPRRFGLSSPRRSSRTYAPARHAVVLGLLGLAAFGCFTTASGTFRPRWKTDSRPFASRPSRLMDQLDALRKRHKTLPATDPDFTVPMQGATLALYGEVNRDLDASLGALALGDGDLGSGPAADPRRLGPGDQADGGGEEAARGRRDR